VEEIMKIKTRKVGNIVVLDISGKITTGEPTVNLGKAFKDLVAQGEKRFVFNMLGVPWLDSGGIGAVVAYNKRVVDHEGVIRLVLKGRAHDLFTLTSLDRVFKIFSTVEEALASFADWKFVPRVDQEKADREKKPATRPSPRPPA
jgi:anti-anti-sigma factor